MNKLLSDEEILSLINQSEFKDFGPFDLVSPVDGTHRRIETRHGKLCYVAQSSMSGLYFYVHLDETVEQEKKIYPKTNEEE